MSRPIQDYSAPAGEVLPDQGETQLRQSMFTAAKTTPDTSAKAQELSTASGIPADVILRNMDTVQQQAVVEQVPYKKLSSQTPKLNYWLQDPANASVAHDDLHSMGMMEWLLNKAGQGTDFVRSLVGGVPSGTGEALTGLKGLNDVAARQITSGLWFLADLTDSESVKNAVRWMTESPLPAWADPYRGVETSGNLLKQAGTFVAPPKQRETLLTKIGDTIGKIAPAVAGSLVGGPEVGTAVFMGQGADAAIQTTASDLEAPALPTPAGLIEPGNITSLFDRKKIHNPDGSVSTTISKSFNFDGREVLIPTVVDGVHLTDQQAIAHYRTTGEHLGIFDSPESANAYSELLTKAQGDYIDRQSPQVYRDLLTLGYSAVMGLGGEFGLDKILNRAPLQFIKNKALLKIADLAAAGATQTAVVTGQTTLDQWLHHYLTNPNVPLTPQFGEDQAVAFATGAILRGLIGPSAPFAARQHAIEQETLFKAMGEGIKESKLYKRLPDNLRAYLAHVTKDGPVENVYVPVEDWTKYWQSKGKDPGDAAAVNIEGGRDKYEAALVSGEDLKIPTANYATNIAPTEHNAHFARELKLDPNGMSAREAEEFNVKAEEALLAMIDEAKQSPEAKTQSSAEQVGQDVVGQMVNTGYDRGTIDAYGRLYEAVFGAIGKRAGMDPKELYDRYGLNIVRPLPDVLKQRPVDQLDLMIDRIRQGRIPTDRELFGPTLMEFVREHGGVKDHQGELAALEIDRNNRAFQRNFVQPKTGLDMDVMREKAVEAGYLSEGSTPADFIDAIDSEMRGQAKRSVMFDVDQKKQEEQLVLAQLENYIRESGIDLATVTNDQIKRVIENAGKIEQSGDGVEFLHKGDDEKLGATKFNPKDRLFNIELYRRANLSTFLHESAHFFLEVLGDVVDHLKTLDPETMTAEQRGMVEDYGKALKWMGLESRPDFNDVDAHEKFARGFEAYLREGKAPEIGLRSIFARFKAWLTQIYKHLRDLNVELTPEVTGVMDRLLAVDSAIDEARRQAEIVSPFADQAASGMDDNAWAAYQKTLQEASAAAQDAVQQKAMKDLSRQHTEWWQSERAAVRNGIADQVHKQKEYVALSVLQRGKYPDGSEYPDAFKLDRDALIKQFGKKALKTLPRPYVYAAEGGVAPEAAAEHFGYDSAEEMFHALVNARPMNELIDAQADAAMKERHGDMLLDGSLADEAREAVLTQGRSEVIRAEMMALAAKRREMRPFERAAVKDAAAAEKAKREAGADLISRFVPEVEAVRFIAENRIADTKIKDIQPGVFFAAARRSSKAATEAVLAGDYDAALAGKQRELLNVELYRAAVNAQDEIAKAKDRFAKMFASDTVVGKSRNMDYVAAARAIVARYLYPGRNDDVAAALDLVRKYDPDLFDVLDEKIKDALEPGKTLKDLTFDQFVAMRDSVLSLWSQARRQNQIFIDGKLQDRAEAVGSLMTRLLQFKNPGEKAGYAHAATQWDRTKMYLLGIKAALRRVESWVDAMDGGNPDGAFRKYIWNPISEGTAAYRLGRLKYLTKYMELVKGIESSVTNDRIAAPELAYTFSGKAELLHAILHTGNESNKSKLLRGRKGSGGISWGAYTFDGRVDSTMWDRFVSRLQKTGVLTKADYDFVQGVWDLLEELKPLAQKAHHDMYGFYFNEITHTPFETLFGTYRGGYVPAIVDPLLAPDAAIRGDKEALLESGNSFMFPTTGRGFTKARIEQYAKPLALDLRYIPSHIDKVLKFVHIEPHVKDVGRVLFDHRFRAMLNDHDPTVAGDMLVPWLQRAAAQRIATGSKGWGGRAADAFFKTVRRRVGLQIMAANVTNTLSQLHGFTLSALKVRNGSLAEALWQYVRAPLQTAEMVNDKSDFMKTRMTSQQAEIQKTIDDILLNPSTFEKSRAWINEHAYFMQHATHGAVGVTTWVAAYNEAIEGGRSESEAVRQADSVVRETQGSFAPEDVSRFESSSPFVRAFSMFYSFFNNQANLLTTEFSKIATEEMGLKKGAGRALYVYTMGFLVPSILYEGIRAAMAGWIDPDEDGSYLLPFLELFFGSQLKSAAAMVPIAGPIVNAVVNHFNHNPNDDDIRVSPAVTTLEAATKAPGDVYSALVKRELTGTQIKDVMTMLGLLSGIPTGPVSNALKYLNEVDRGRIAPPANSVDAVRGLLSGTGPKR